MMIEIDDDFYLVCRVSFLDKDTYEDRYSCQVDIGTISGKGINIDLIDWDKFMQLVHQADAEMQKAKLHYESLKPKPIKTEECNNI